MRIDYLKTARDLIVVSEDDEIEGEEKTRAVEAAAVARRYVNVRRREKVARERLRKAAAKLREGNVLRKAGFSAPLSVAGEPAGVVVRAEALLLAGIPVALAYDSKGRHAGTPIDEVRVALAAIGADPGDEAIFAAYAAFMAKGEALVRSSRDRRARRPPALLDRLWMLRDWLEREICRHVLRSHHPDRGKRFAAIAGAEEVGVLLAEDPALFKADALVLAYTEESRLSINKRPVPAKWGEGRGLAVVRRADLAALLDAARHAVLIEIFADHWHGYADATPLTPGAKAMQFDFYAPPAK